MGSGEVYRHSRRDHRHSQSPAARWVSDGLIYDAVRVRLIEIGEAVKGISSTVLAEEPETPWQDITRMRDRLTHHYFDTSHSIVQGTVDHDLPKLEEAVLRLQAEAGSGSL
jgi:uncharacterized protein with HEPN domain